MLSYWTALLPEFLFYFSEHLCYSKVETLSQRQKVELLQAESSEFMKVILGVLGVIAVYYLFGINDILHMIGNQFDFMMNQPHEDWATQLKAASDPSWQDKLQHTDLVTLLKAASGSTR